MGTVRYALEPDRFLRSVDASRDTLGKGSVKLLSVIEEVRSLIFGRPYAVVGGVAQILWARKTHTDDLNVALAAEDLAAAHDRVVKGGAGPGWDVPAPPDRAHEECDVFEVYHLLFKGTVVDLLSFRDEEFTREILASACEVPELGDVRFIRPELLLVTHLLRPGAHAVLAAVELLVSRRELGDWNHAVVRRWASRLDRQQALERVSSLADQVAG